MKNEQIIVFRASIAFFVQMVSFTIASIASDLWGANNPDALIGRIDRNEFMMWK
jgi:hypothetical protein